MGQPRQGHRHHIMHTLVVEQPHRSHDWLTRSSTRPRPRPCPCPRPRACTACWNYGLKEVSFRSRNICGDQGCVSGNVNSWSLWNYKKSDQGFSEHLLNSMVQRPRSGRCWNGDRSRGNHVTCVCHCFDEHSEHGLHRRSTLFMNMTQKCCMMQTFVTLGASNSEPGLMIPFSKRAATAN